MSKAAAILPSILSAPFSSLEPSLRVLEDAGAEVFHYDVMDGHFVPNLSVGPVVIDSLIKHKVDTRFDVHLMVTNPELQMKWFRKSTVRSVSIHTETTQNIRGALRWLRENGLESGIALNPPSPVKDLFPLLEQTDQILVMSVYPGFSGQKFLQEALPKIESLVVERERQGLSFRIQVDGGINEETIRWVSEAGADEIVSGSAIFDAADPAATFQSLTNLANSPQQAAAS